MNTASHKTSMLRETPFKGHLKANSAPLREGFSLILSRSYFVAFIRAWPTLVRLFFLAT
jgi:hypothetical protein